MSTLEDIVRIAHEVLGGKDRSVSPSTLLDELFKIDVYLLMKFLLEVDSKYNIEFKDADVYGRETGELTSVSCDDDFALLGNWSLQQLADYIDSSRS